MALGGFALGLGLFAAAILAALTGVLWRLLARRVPWLGWTVVAVGALLVVGCFVPPPRLDSVSSLQGRVEGSAWIPVQAAPEAAVTSPGGTASLQRLPNGTWLVLDCPSGCDLRGGASSDEPARSLGIDATALSQASIHGDARLIHTLWSCSRLPLVVGLAFGRSDCVRCYDAVYASTPEGALQGGPGPAC